MIEKLLYFFTWLEYFVGEKSRFSAKILRA